MFPPYSIYLVTWYIVFDKMKIIMYKLKNRLLPYSPTQKVIMNVSTGSIPSTEPSSPISTASLIFNGKYWDMPLTDGDMDPQNFHQSITSSPKIGGYSGN